MKTGAKRLPELMLPNLLFCLLVVLIHCFSSAVTSVERSFGAASAAVYFPWRLSAFVVQGFFFLSGLKLTLGGRVYRWRSYFCSRVRKILLPYCFWVGVYYLYFFSIGWAGHTGSVSGDLAEFGRYLLIGNLSSHFYFVICLLQFYLLAPILLKLCRSVCAPVMLTGAAAVMVLCHFALPDILGTFGVEFAYNDRIFTTYLFYFVAGCIAGDRYEEFRIMLAKSRTALTVLFCCFALIDGIFGYRQFLGLGVYSWLESAHICYVIFAILFCMMLCEWVSHLRFAESAVVALFDGATYEVYLIHCLVLNIVNRALEKNGIVRIGSSLMLRLAFVYLLSFAIAIAIAIGISRLNEWRKVRTAKIRK